MDKVVPIIYMVGVLLLVLPSFLNSNNSFKTFFTNLSIWIAIVLVVLSLYFVFQFLLWKFTKLINLIKCGLTRYKYLYELTDVKSICCKIEKVKKYYLFL